MSDDIARYGRNAPLLAERDAILALPPEEQGPALIAWSQRRSGMPSLPGGTREPGPDSEGGAWTEGLPPASGVYADTTRIFPVQRSSKVDGVAEKRGEDASTSTTPEGSRSTTARDALRGITGMSPGQTALLGGRLDLIDRDVALARRQGDIEQSQRRTIAQGEADASRGFAESQRRSAQELERRLQPIPEFVATRETARDIGSLASLLMVAGAALGGKGKQGALMAVQSMTGMMAGYRQGRMDLYQRERQNFETGMRQVQAQNTQLQEAFTRAQRLAQTDLEAARQQFQVEAVRLGATLPNISAERAGLSQGQQILQQAGTALSQAEARRDAEKTRVENATPIVTPGEQPGTFVWVRRDGRPILNPQGQPLEAPPPAGSRSSRDAFGFTAITTGASNEAAASLQNLVTLASSANTGIFQGRNTTGLFNAPLGALANAVTSEQAQRYNVEISNIGKFLSQMQRGGRPVTLADIESNQRTFGIREGDTQNTILTKFATLRQQLERIMEVRIEDPNTAEPLKEIFRRNLETIRAAVPFTVQDVNRFVNSQDETTTFADMFRELGIAQPAGTEERPPPRREAPVPAAGGAAAPQPPPPPTAAGATYNSLAELRAAVDAGTLTREQAFAIAQQRGFRADGR